MVVVNRIDVYKESAGRKHPCNTAVRCDYIVVVASVVLCFNVFGKIGALTDCTLLTVPFEHDVKSVLNGGVTHLYCGDYTVGIVRILFYLKFGSFGVRPVKDLDRFLVVFKGVGDIVLLVSEVKLFGR